MDTKNTPAKVEAGSARDDEFASRSRLNQLLRQQKEFVSWVQKNFTTDSMRRYATEQAAYYFTNEQYDHRIAEMRLKIEQLLDYKMRLVEHYGKRQREMALEQERLRTVLTGMKAERLKTLVDTRRLLEPPDKERDSLEAVRLKERKELLSLQMQQAVRRQQMKAAIATASERAQIRTKFIQEMQEKYDDPELVQEAIDQFDRDLMQTDGNR